MKKIMIFNGYYYPSQNCGGPITSIENIVDGCSDVFDFYIVCYNHDFNDYTPFDREVNKWYEIGNAKVMYVQQGFLDFSKKNMRALLNELKPALIWFSGVLTPNNKIVAAILSRENGIPILFSPRGELSAERVKLKAYKKVPYLKLVKLLGIYKNCYFHGTSDDEIEGIKKFFNPSKDHVFKVANISILPQKDIIEYKKNNDEVKLFFFSRIHEVKNLKYGIEAITKCKKKVIFDIYGPIESEEYWNDCKKLIKEKPENVKIEYKGILAHNELSATIQSHDAFLFPTINENYGHVIAESLANSRPVLLSKGTTPWDDLDNMAGYVISLNNQNEFTKKIDNLAGMSEDEFKDVIKTTKEYFLKKIQVDGAIDNHIRMIQRIISKESLS